MATHNDSPLMLEGPKTAIEPAAPIIDLEPLRASDESAAAEPAAAAPEQPSRWRLPAYAPLAATVVFSLALGAIAGAAATAGLMRDAAPAPVMADATRALQDSVAQLGSELATLKAGVANVQRSASTQLGKLTERLDRAEKTSAEPAAKLAKLQESVDRLDHRPPAAVSSAVADVTGSVTPKEDSKAPIAEGWRLRDFQAGRAVV